LGGLADPAVRKQMLPPGLPTGLPWPLQQLLDWFADWMGRRVLRMLVIKYPEDAAVTEEQVRGDMCKEQQQQQQQKIVLQMLHKKGFWNCLNCV
jgi:hypothetical protein